MGAAGYVEELLGVRGCELIGSATKVDCGRRLQQFDLRYRGPVPASCPECGGTLHSHGARTVGVVSTPHLGIPTRLEIGFPRMRCPECGYVWRPAIGGVDASRLRFKVPAFLGIDEKNLKRVGMVTVITDLEHRTVFDMVPGRTQSDLDAYFSSLEGLERVRWVSSDMYRPFWRSIAKYTPNATWVIDHFHVVRGANEALDAVRKGLQGALDRKGRLELKKGLAYALRKRTRDLSPYEASALRALREDPSYSTLMTAYDLKEDFFGIYDDHPSSREEAEAAFDAWIREIPDGREFDPFRALARTVQNHREFIFNYWECPSRISNGYTECANRLINETDMRGRGYSFETLRARTLYRRQNLDRIIASNGLTIGPRIDAPGPLFVTEPDREDEAVDEFIDPRSGVKVDATTGEVH